jgi:PAS domain S-box-containing protein
MVGGTIKWLQITSSPEPLENGDVLWHGVVVDITERKRIEDALQQSNQKWEAIIAASPDGIGMMALDGKIQLMSDKLVEMYGYSINQKDEFIGRQAIDFIDPSNHKLLIDNIRKLLSGKRDNKVTEYLAVKKDNSRFYIEVNSTVLLDSNDNPAGILFAERDITERKRAEEALQQSKQKWEAIVSASPDGIGMMSLDGKLQLVSDKLAEMFGYSIDQKDELIGKAALDFVDPSNYKILIDNINKVLSGNRDDKVTEYLAIKKDNSRIYIEVNSSVLFDSNGNPVSILFAERDITERKRAEVIIQQQYNQLKELNAAKDKFFSIIAHDLKSPFQSLLGSSELLATQIESLSQEEVILFSKGLNDNLKNLHDLLENLLNWSLMQRNVLAYNPVNLSLYEVVNKIIGVSNLSAQNKNISISNNIDKDTFVYADVDMLHSVVENLIINAIKFTLTDGRINISSNERGSFVEVSVLDTGIGIDQGKIPELFNFDAVFTTDGTSGEKGTGLGLSLCKEFIEKNGGKIWVESEVGKGSEFKFTLRKSEGKGML